MITFVILDLSDRSEFEKFLSHEVMGIPILWLCVGAGCILIIGLVTILIVFKVKRNRGKSVLLEYEGMNTFSFLFTQS